jgi:hypothetical protein
MVAAFRQRVDASAATALSMCTCGWREMRATRADAWGAAHAHCREQHPGETEYTAHRLEYHRGQA